MGLMKDPVKPGAVTVTADIPGLGTFSAFAELVPGRGLNAPLYEATRRLGDLIREAAEKNGVQP